MPRVIAGDARGRTLLVPKGITVRPTSDRAREALFSALAHRLPGGFSSLEALDLFAGAGTLGLEALSRGAARVTFVESDAAVAAVLRRNLHTVAGDDDGRATLVIAPVARFLSGPPRPHDLVFLDPPYAAGLVTGTLSAVLRGWLAPGGLVCVESPDPIPLSKGLTPVFARRYGAAMLSIFCNGEIVSPAHGRPPQTSARSET